jgi:hypothetical protein
MKAKLSFLIDEKYSPSHKLTISQSAFFCLERLTVAIDNDQ